jgi:hypothetical protein
MPTTTIVETTQTTPVVMNIYQGRDLMFTTTFVSRDEDTLVDTPIDFTGYTAYAQIRDDYYEDGGTLLLELTETPDADGNSLTIIDADGQVNVRIDRVLTETLSARRRYYFELKMTSGAGNKTFGVIAKLRVKKEVARLV